MKKRSIFILLLFAFVLFNLCFSDEKIKPLTCTNNQHSSLNQVSAINRTNRAALYENFTTQVNAYTSQEFGVGMETMDSQAADDFTLPAGLWKIESISALGALTSGIPPFDSVNVFFYNDVGGAPAEIEFQSFLGITSIDDGLGNLDITIPGGFNLAGGTYWISIQNANTFSINGQWFWVAIDNQLNGQAHWRNPGDGFGTGYTTWTNANTQFGDGPVDMAFGLYGEIVLTNPPPPLAGSGKCLDFDGVDDYVRIYGGSGALRANQDYSLNAEETGLKSSPMIEYNKADYPDMTRQGGDNIASAFVIGSLPFTDSGTTSGYTDDYDEVCPYSGSTSPDVVYEYTAPAGITELHVDLCNSLYDTKVYIYENVVTPGFPIACNDDYYFDPGCGVFVSALFNVPVTPGNVYYIVVDGYNGQSGDYEILVDGEGELDFTTAMTVEGWFKVDTFDKDWQALVTKGTSAWSIHRYANTDYLRFYSSHTTGTNGINSTTNVNDGRWHHFAAVFSDSNKYLYIDGILEATAEGVGPLNTNDDPVLIGENAFATGRHFDGEIDEVRIWNIGRTESEIRADMCQKISGSESGLVGYWRFDESAGLYTYDYSGGANHGYLVNMEDPDDHIWSGAPIGDWSAASYYIPTPIRDSEGVPSNEITMNRYGLWGAQYYGTLFQLSGIHFYEIYEPPNTTDMCGYLETLGNEYFGFFICGGTTKYDFGYSYNGYPQLGAECTYDLARRANNADMMWDQTYAIQYMDQDRLHLYGETGTEYILGATENLYYTCSDTIAYDTEWCDVDTVFVICDVLVPEDITLSICEDIIVSFVDWVEPNGTAIDVYGKLEANGSPGNEVVFTAGDINSGWAGVRLWGDPSDPDSSHFEYCLFEYAKTGTLPPTREEEIMEPAKVRNNNNNQRYYYGGALYMLNSTAVVDNCEFAYNFAEEGGAILVWEGAPTITNTYIHHNTAEEFGGGISIYYVEPGIVFNNNIIVNNWSLYNGGGMEIAYSEDVLIENCVIDSNRAHAITRENSLAVSVDQRTTLGDGGGVAIFEDTYPNPETEVTFINCDFKNNYASNNGGAVHTSDDCRVNIYYSDMLENEALLNGGALFNDDLAYLFNCDVSHNTSASNGGAFASFNANSLSLYNTLISYNEAVRGGALYFDFTTDVNLHNCDVVDNYASQNGGGIWFNNSILNLVNSIIWGNVADLYGTQIYDDGGATDLNLRNCILEGGDGGIHEDRYTWTFEFVNLDPKFMDASSGNYNLKSNSPAINTGTPDTTGLNLPVVDLNGDPRIYNGDIPRIDIGCIEFQGDPSVQYLFDGFTEDTYLCADSILVYTNPIIPPDVSVIICPGTTVMHMGPMRGSERDRGYGYGWLIEGCLFAVGTELERITFTADSSLPGWSGLYFYNGDNDFYPSRLKYCDIEYTFNWQGLDIPYFDYESINFFGAAVNLLDYSNIRISESDFRYNLGVLGGGIGVHGQSYPYIQDNYFHENFALGGGGIFWSPNFAYSQFRDRPLVVDSTFVIANNTFEDNWAVSGGGVYLQQHLNEFYGPDFGEEFNADLEVEIYDNTFTNNISIGNLQILEMLEVLQQLGIYDFDLREENYHVNNLINLYDQEDVMSSYQERFGNTRFQIWSGGGGIFSGNLSPHIYNNEFIGNGALGIYDVGHFGDAGSTTNNWFASRGGGIFTGFDPIYYFDGVDRTREFGIPHPIIHNNLVSDNFTWSLSDGGYHFETAYDWGPYYAAVGSGAGIYNVYGYLDLRENEILDNEIMLQDFDLRNILNTQGESRSIAFGFAGGGVYHLEPSYGPGRDEGQTSIIQSNVIDGNSALYGAGIFIDSPGAPNFNTRESIPDFIVKIHNNLITNNRANWDWELLSPSVFSYYSPPGGGGIYLGAYENCTLFNNTIADNQAFAGGGIAVTNDGLLCVNNIVWGNLSDWGSGEFSPDQFYFLNDFYPTDPNLYFNDIQDGASEFGRDWYTDDGNIDADPVFAGTGQHPYMLTDNTPCANAGDPAITFADLDSLYLPHFDLRGADRIYNETREGIIDMGAYETGNNPPYDIILGSPGSVPENEAPGYFVGLLSTLDLDEFDTHTYSLVAGDGDVNNADFEIINDSLFTAVTFDYEEGFTRADNELNDQAKNFNSRPVLPNAWINEIHYDNVSTDTGEFVEIVIENASLYDLSMFTLTLYNGSSSQRKPYGTPQSLDNFTPGVIVGAYSFYYFTYPSNGIQNGAPDGLCLDFDGQVIQFLSYEGSFTAKTVGEGGSGPAAGMTTVDIGVTEGGGTQVGESLQLANSGRLGYSNFNWQYPLTETPGLINVNQNFEPAFELFIRVRTTDDGENNMYYEEVLVVNLLDANDGPLIDLPEEFAFDEDETLPVDFDPYIFDEDILPGPDLLTLSVSGNTHVAVQITGLDVEFSNTPEDWNGSEILTFTVNDNAGRAIASDDVLVIVEPVNDNPFFEIPLDSLYMFVSDEDQPFMIDFCDKGFIWQAFGEADPFEINIVSQTPASAPAMNPLITSINGCEVTFTPEANQYGSVEVTLEVYDLPTRNVISKKTGPGKLSINSNGDREAIIYNQTFTVTFEPVNDPPILEIPIPLTALEDDPSQVYNFLLPPFVVDQTWGEGDSLSLSAIGSTHIDVTTAGFNVVIESNTLDWNGTEDLTFILDDNVSRLTTTVVVQGIIGPYNDPPVLGFIDDIVMDEDTTYDFTATATDVDNTPGELTFSAYVQSGNLSVNVVDDLVTVIPDPDWYGEGSIVVKVYDGMWYDQQLVLVTVNNLNDPPLLTLPDSFSFAEDDSLEVDFFPFITDADDLGSRLDDYTIELVGTPAAIDVAIDGTMVTFGTLAENWTGTETLTFVVNDNVGTRLSSKGSFATKSNDRDISPEETVDIIVTEVNDAPYVIAPLVDFSFPEDTSDSSIDLNTVFDDPDLIYGDVLSFSYDIGFYTGMTIEITAGVVTLTPDPDWNGIFGITFIATDTGGLTAEDYVEVTVTPVNDDPVLDLPDELSFFEDGELVTNFLQYVEDVDGDDLVLTIGETTNISIEQNLFALVFSTVEEDWNGAEMITFTLSDGVTRAVASDDVNIVVIPQNDPPEYIGTNLVTVPEEFGTYTIGDLDLMFTDVEDDELTFTLDFFNPAMLSAEIDVDNNLIITSVENACGNTSVAVTANDGEYDVQQAIPIVIEPVNDPPQLVNLPEHIEMGAYSNMILNLDDCWLDVDDTPTMMIIPAPNFITVEQLPGYDFRFRLNALHIAGMEDIITVYLFDGVTQVSEDILVTVAESEAPIITFLIPNLCYEEDFPLTEVVDLDQCFADPEGMPLTFGAYEVGGMGYLEVVVDEDNVLHLGNGLADWNGEVCVDVWANDASTRTQTTQTINIQVMPVNDPPYLIGTIDDVTLAEDFGTYTVADLTTIFADVDNENLIYSVSSLARSVVTAGLEGSTLMLYSVANAWGEADFRVWADDGSGRAVTWVDFGVTVTPVYDTPTFDPNLDGMEFPIAIEGEIIDFSPWIETYGQENSIPMSIVLQGEETYYEVSNVDGMIYCMFAYPVGYQWAFPDQECQLWLDGGSHVTIILQTDLPDVTIISGGTLLLQSGEIVRIDLRKEYNSAKNFLQVNAHSRLSNVFDDELVIGCETKERIEEDVTIAMETQGILQQVIYKVIIEPREEDVPVFVTELRGNNPNPFNPATNIEFSLSQAEHAVITIYNIKGEKVRTLTDNDYTAGIHSVHWNGRDDSGCCVSSGIYFYKLEAGATNKIKKMMLLQ